ncbi:MAG: phosphopyruvate hydratase [Nitrospira sp.]
MSKIKSFLASEVFDSRGNPTVSVVCELESGSSAVVSVPSGASTGSHEALELRDGDPAVFNGKGVSKVIKNINDEINEYFSGKDLNQKDFDSQLIELDGTKNKSRLGSNGTLSVSLAFAKAKASENNQELYEYVGAISNNNNFKIPFPAFNIINGGKHANSGLEIQEFMIVPVGFKTFSQRLDSAKKVVDSLHDLLSKNNLETNLGDEGGFAPKLKDNHEALRFISESITNAGFSFDEIKIALDCAGTSFFEDGFYKIKIDGVEEKVSKESLLDYYVGLAKDFPIISIEDPFVEEDWQSFGNLLAKIGSSVNVVGDDLTVTNIERIKEAQKNSSINSVIIKPNQIGTLSETVDAVSMVKNNKWKAFASHRSGETMDTFISDIAVGLDCDYIKAGSTTKPERMCKYDRFLEIENRLKK